MKKRTLYITIALAVAVAALIIYSAVSGKEKEIVLEAKVENGPFEIAVMVTGELQALNETEIRGPSALRSRSLRIHNVKIQELITEGTVVDSGDWVATLDRSEADNMLKDILDELERLESVYTRRKLDTTIELRNLRDNLINLKFNAEEAKIKLEQSQYEPPATIRQAEIDLERAQRSYKQAVENYALKEREAKAEVREAQINLEKVQRQQAEMMAALEEFDIRAPAPGMVIYKRNWRGEKRTAGSEINPWDLAVATLPDLSEMISRTYVNEIDISKISEGQQVKIGVDAFPEKEYSGDVFEVANIGEQLPRTDAKVFEVRIRLNENDTILRPSMTTSNRIITNVLEDVNFLPLEAVRSNDSVSYVYTPQKERKIIVLGESNENYIIVEQGLKKGETVFLSTPDDPDAYNFTNLELVEVIRQKEMEEQRQKELQESNRQAARSINSGDKGTVRIEQ